jgi:bifunctional non-homologous end joining protein LigD
MSAGAAVLVSGVPISNPRKVFWPAEGYTKLDLVRFYETVFPWLGPYVRGRLLSMERCPDGMRGDCFYQKQRPERLPEGTPTKLIRHQDHPIRYVVGGRKDTQLFLVNYGCIPIHVWGSRATAPRRPDWVCFDLDPPGEAFADAARAALRLKAALDALGLRSFPKTSGGKGLHVFVPIRVGPDADEVLDFAAGLAARLAAAFPGELTTESRIARRGGRVYLDALRNAYAQTVVAPYSVRRRAGAPVSTPLDWAEVRPGLDPGRFTIRTVPARLRRADPWADFFRRRQSLRPALRTLRQL